jgi:hypothetical protein
MNREHEEDHLFFHLDVTATDRIFSYLFFGEVSKRRFLCANSTSVDRGTFTGN